MPNFGVWLTWGARRKPLWDWQEDESLRRSVCWACDRLAVTASDHTASQAPPFREPAHQSHGDDSNPAPRPPGLLLFVSCYSLTHLSAEIRQILSQFTAFSRRRQGSFISHPHAHHSRHCQLLFLPWPLPSSAVQVCGFYPQMCLAVSLLGPHLLGLLLPLRWT